MKIKRIIVVVFTTLLLVSLPLLAQEGKTTGCFSQKANAASDYLASGYCGDVSNGQDGTNIAWTLQSGLLKLEGTGVMGSTPNWNDSRLRRIVVGEGITGLADHAFENCTNLWSVTLPSTLETIGDYAFDGDAALTPVNLKGTKSIGEYAFRGCAGLTSLALPQSITDIGAHAFEKCTKLTSVALPDALETAAASLFSGCTSLETVSFGSRLKAIKGSAFANTAVGTLSLPEGLESIGGRAFYECENLTTVTFPSSLLSIGGEAFFHCAILKAPQLPASLRSIGERAFMSCIAISGTVTIPDACETVGEDAFSYTSVNKLQIGAGVKEFGRMEFMQYLYTISLATGNTTLKLYKNVLYSSDYASILLLPRELGTLYLPKQFPLQTKKAADGSEHPFNFIEELFFRGSIQPSVSSIVASQYSDSYASLNGVLYTKDKRSLVICPPLWKGGTLTAAEETERIEDYACKGVEALTSVVFPEGLAYIGQYAFSGTALSEADIPAGVQTIGSYAFYNTKLQSLTLHEGLVTIGSDAFYDCFTAPDSNTAYTGQTALTIPDSVELIGSSAFAGCKGIKQVTLGNGLRELADLAFAGCSLSGRLVIPDSCETIGWHALRSTSPSVIRLGAGLRKLPSSSGIFLDCASLGSIELSPENEAFDLYDGVLYTADHTKIAGMTNVSSLNLPADFPLHTVSFSGEEDDLINFLNNCTFLTSINAHPDSPWYSSLDGILYTKDGKMLVSCPAGKRTAVIADGTEVIAARAFKECSSLTSMTVPGSVKRIGDKAFYNCKSMRNLTLTEGLEEIGDDAFNSGLLVFNGAPLQSLSIPSSVVSIGDRAFRSTQITSLTLQEGLKRIGEEAFYRCRKLKTVSIPDSVEELGAKAFKACSALTEVTIGSGIRVLDNQEFSGCSALRTLAVSDSFQSWERHERTKAYMLFDNDTTKYSNLTSLRFPNPYTTIAEIGLLSPPSGGTGTVYGYCGSPAHELAIKRLFNWSSLGHTFLDWYTSVPATCEKAGIQRRDCAYCGYFEQRQIPQLEPETFTATFTADGRTVAQIDFPKGASSLEEPAVPTKDRYLGEWEPYTLADKDITVSAMYTLITGGDTGDIETEASATHYVVNDDVLFRMTARSPAKTVRSVVSQSIPLDIVLVVDQSGSMDDPLGGSVRKIDALKSAAHEFIDGVAANAALTGADHRIAVVGFGLAGRYSGYQLNENTELLTSGRGTVPFAEITPADYASALIGMDRKDLLDAAVDAIEARGATAADLGLEMAKGVFSNTDSEGRDHIVVFMTDGAPTYQSGFQTAVANSAVANAGILKNTYGALIYSVGVFSEEDAHNAGILRFMEAVSSDYPNARSITAMGAARSDTFFTTVSHTEALSGVFRTITTESLSHTASFDRVTLIKTLSRYVTLTAPQEQTLRINAIRQFGISNDQITVFRHDDGTTTVRLDGLSPQETTKDGRVCYEVSFEFFASLNENASQAAAYPVDTEDSGVILDGAPGYEAVFSTSTLTLSESCTRYLFAINGELYEIAEAPTLEMAVPEVDFAEDWQFSGWDVLNAADCNGILLDATLVKAPHSVVWHTDGEDVSQIYTEGMFLNVPEVPDNANGGKFLSWNRSLPTVMPDEDLEFTAIYGDHIHQYVSREELPATCTADGILLFRCVCGDSYTREIPASGHSFEAITPSTDQDVSRCTFVCTNCGLRYEYALDYRIKLNAMQGRMLSYEFQLTDDDLNLGFEPDGSIDIRIPLSDFQSTARHVRVTRIVNGRTESVPARIEDGFLIITADHFTPYDIELIFPCMESGEHEWSEPRLSKEASCSQRGELVRTCGLCGSEDKTYTELAPDRHENIVFRAAEAPTCFSEGHTEGRICLACGTILEGLEALPKTEHTWDNGTVTTAPTCSSTGYLTRQCTAAGCGTTEVTEIPADPEAHRFRTTVTEPTCTQGGCTVYTCTLCSFSYSDNTTEAAGHLYVVRTVPPTCTDPGYTSYTCIRCYDRFENDITDPTGHTDEDGDGRCDVCGMDSLTSEPAPNCVCGQFHTGPLAPFVRFFHTVLHFFRVLFGR